MSEKLRDHLEDIVKEKKVARKAFLLKSGQVCTNVYFVGEGLFRSFYIKDSKDISTAFMKEGDLCIAVESFLTQRYTQESIQAIEDSIVYYITYDDLQRIYREFPEFNRFGRLVVEQCYLRSVQRLTAMWMQRSEDRYEWLIRIAPDLTQRVPAKYLASYLGVTEAMISKIKSRR